MKNLSFQIVKWAKMLVGRSQLHVRQGKGRCYTLGRISGYYNDLTHKVTDFPHTPGQIPLTPLSDDPTPREFSIAIFQWGLACHDLYLMNQDEQMLSDAILCADWGVEHIDANGGWVTFDTINPDNPYSAMAQGEGISLLLRIWQQIQDDRYRECCEQALAFMTDQLNGLFKRDSGQGIVLLEYPHLSAVLNGWIFALWGLYDYLVLFPEKDSVKDFYDCSLQALKESLPEFSKRYWSMYDLSGKIASTHYMRIHTAQLQVLYEMTSIDEFEHYATLWQKRLSNPILRFHAFVIKSWQKIREIL